MIYLIGGPPKCGKTTCAKQFAKSSGIPWISTDSLHCVANAFIPESEKAEKFPWSELRKKTNRVNDVLYEQYSAAEIIDLYRVPVQTTKIALDAFVASELAEENDYIIEGNVIEPLVVKELEELYGSENFRVVFVVKLDSVLFVENIDKSQTKNDWIIRRTEDPEKTYPRIAKMICEYGRIIKEEANTDGFEVFVMDEGFEEQMRSITMFLNR